VENYSRLLLFATLTVVTGSCVWVFCCFSHRFYTAQGKSIKMLLCYCITLCWT